MTMIETVTDIDGNALRIERIHAAPCWVRLGWQDGASIYRGLVIKFGLHAMRGNRLPHFGITATEYENSFETAGGCLHDRILERIPELADLVALHLSGIDGQPMHAEANGWYWLAGAAGGLGEEYHGGNQEYAQPGLDPLKVFADHCRVSRTRAEEIIADVTSIEPVAWADSPHYIQRQRWQVICAGMAERWQAEARAAIERYGLNVYGNIQLDYTATLDLCMAPPAHE